MHPVPVPFEFLAPGLVFAAGGFYFVVRSTLQRLGIDINGIGRKVGDLKQEAWRAEFRNAVITLTYCSPNKREKIAEFLLEGK